MNGLISEFTRDLPDVFFDIISIQKLPEKNKYYMPAKSEKQQRLFFAVKNCQEKGNCPKSKKIRDIAKNMDPRDVEKFTHLESKMITFKEFVESKENKKCECKCKPCINGDCKKCTCKDCKCKNCKCSA
jgi:hypothetical protein